MGNPSFLSYSELNVKDWNKFYYHLAVNAKEVPSFISAEIKDFDKEKAAKLVALKLAGNEESKVPQYYINTIKHIQEGKNYNAEGDIFLDLDEWKIQQYWYDEFCQFLWLLQTAGLRGHIEMTYECMQNFNIYFNEDDVEVEIFKEQQQDEEGNILNEKEATEVYETYPLSSLSRTPRQL